MACNLINNHIEWYFKFWGSDVYMIINSDNLGRIVIPKAMRDSLGVKPYDLLKVEQKKDSIVLTKVIYKFDLEKFIKDYILYYFGAEHRDLLLSKVNLKEIESLLSGYLIKLIDNDAK